MTDLNLTLSEITKTGFVAKLPKYHSSFNMPQFCKIQIDDIHIFLPLSRLAQLGQVLVMVLRVVQLLAMMVEIHMT